MLDFMYETFQRFTEQPYPIIRAFTFVVTLQIVVLVSLESVRTSYYKKQYRIDEQDK